MPDIVFKSEKDLAGWLHPDFRRTLWIGGHSWDSITHLALARRFGLETNWAEMIRFERTPVLARTKYTELVAKGVALAITPLTGLDVSNYLECIHASVIQHRSVQHQLEATKGSHIVYDVTPRKKSETPDVFWGAQRAGAKGEMWLGQNTLGMLWVGLRDEIMRAAQPEEKA